jgi:hypothetical protein
MARVGVLSDLAVKQRNPEWFPLDVGGQELMHPIHLQKNIFKGIKPPKRIKRFTDVSRFPINDLKNFSTFGSAGRDKEAAFMAIMNYRKELGSNNYPSHMQTAFQARNNSDYTPAPLFRPDEGAGGVQAPATLSLGRYMRKEGQDAFSRAVVGSRSFLSARMRATLANIAEPADYPTLMSYLVPGGLPTKISDEEVKSKLNKIYRDDPEQLGIIERAWHASGRHDLVPIPMTNEEEVYEPFNEPINEE